MPGSKKRNKEEQRKNIQAARRVKGRTDNLAAGATNFAAAAGTAAASQSAVVTATGPVKGKPTPATSALAEAAKRAATDEKGLDDAAVELGKASDKFRATASGKPPAKSPPPPAAAAENKEKADDDYDDSLGRALFARQASSGAGAENAAAAARRTAGQKTTTELIGRMVLQILDEIDLDIKDVQSYQTSDISTPLGKGKNDTMVALSTELNAKRKLLPDTQSLREELKGQEEEKGKNVLSDSNRFNLETYREEVIKIFNDAETQLKQLVATRSASNLGDFKGNVGLCGEAIDRAKMKFADVIRILETAKRKIADNSKKASSPSLFSSPKSAAASPQLRGDANESLVRWLNEKVKGMEKAYKALEGESGENYIRLKECIRHVNNILHNYTPVLNGEQRFLSAISSLTQAYERNMRKREKTIMSGKNVTREEYNDYAKALNNPLSIKHHYSRMLGLVLKNAVDMYQDKQGKSLQDDLDSSGYLGKSALPSVSLIDNVSRKEYAFLKEEADAAPKPKR